MMKRLFALALMCSASAAFACSNGATNYPQCDNFPKPDKTIPTPVKNRAESSSNSKAWSAANSAASSRSAVGDVSTGPSTANAAGGNANAAGGAAKQGQAQRQQQQQQSSNTNTSPSSAASDDHSSSSMRAYAIALPPPAFTPPLPMTCPNADVTQSSRSIGWGFASWADSHSSSRDCTLITVINEMNQQCQFASAMQVKTKLVRAYFPDYKDSSGAYEDLTTEECDILLHPVTVVPGPERVVTETVFIDRPVQQSCNIAPKPYKKLAAKKPKACTP